MTDDMKPDKELLDWVVQLRRWFHQNPELSFEEHQTQKRIIEILDSLGIENRKVAETGVIGTIHGKEKGKTIAIRADMDALRIQEPETDLNKEYRSKNDGVMHACGHDGHMAMVLAAARLLQERRENLKGNVRLIFQPAEEKLPGGAVRVIKDRGLDGVDAIVGVHLLGGADAGEIRYRAGPYLAHPCDYNLRIRGKGGHHMCPQECIDPLMIAARFISSVQTDIKTRLDPKCIYVLGFGTIKGGTQYNQTPDQVAISGSFRAFDDATAQTIEQTMRRNLDSLMEQHRNPNAGTEPHYELKVVSGYPVLVNDAKFVHRATTVLKERFPSVVDNVDLNLGAEDFAYYLEKIPGMFMFLGASNREKGITEVNHSSRFDIDEDVLGTGVRILTTLTLDFLDTPEQYIIKGT